jgi:hypothetical protein
MLDGANKNGGALILSAIAFRRISWAIGQIESQKAHVTMLHKPLQVKWSATSS